MRKLNDTLGALARPIRAWLARYLSRPRDFDVAPCFDETKPRLQADFGDPERIFDDSIEYPGGPAASSR